MVAQCPCFCPVPSVSQNNLVWWWYSVKLFIFRKKYYNPAIGCWASSQLSAVRDCFTIFFFFLSFLHPSAHLCVLRQLECLFSERKKSNFFYHLIKHDWILEYKSQEKAKKQQPPPPFKKPFMHKHGSVLTMHVHVTTLLKVHIPFKQMFIAALQA